MRDTILRIRLVLAGVACVCLSGCLDLKPARPTAQYFVLSPIAPAVPANTAPGSASGLAVGLGQVKLPGYLFRNLLVVREGTNQIQYLENALWAESLNTGFQRVLAVDLGTLLASDQVRLSTWRKDDVAMGVYVVVERFDVDSQGQGVLTAWWRILSPGGEKIVKAGQFRGVRQGASPRTNPAAAAGLLSELISDLSRELAAAIREVPKPALQGGSS